MSSTPRPADAPGLDDDADTLARDLTSISLTPGTSASTRVTPALTLLAPPPIAWGVSASLGSPCHGSSHVIFVGTPTCGSGGASFTKPGDAGSIICKERTIGVQPHPFQASFDTSAFTNMYVDLPFRSECLDSEEEDGPGPGLDFSGLRGPEAMLQFLFACDDLLFNGSNDYNSDEEG
jgi:hypothetical protein